MVSADRWPVLKKFKKEHVAKGVLLDVGYGSTVENTQAFLHTRNKETYVYPDSTFFYQCKLFYKASEVVSVSAWIIILFPVTGRHENPC